MAKDVFGEVHLSMTTIDCAAILSGNVEAKGSIGEDGWPVVINCAAVLPGCVSVEGCICEAGCLGTAVIDCTAVLPGCV